MAVGLVILCTCLVSVHLVCGTAVDNTLVSGSIGANVVEASVEKIRRSGIFREDYDFLRRIAYVETLDGAELDVQEPGGMWQMNSTHLEFMVNNTYDVTSYFARVTSSFGIDFTTVTYDNLSIPLYGALAMRMYMAYLEPILPEPSSDIFQAATWAVSITTTGETVTYYTERIVNFTTGCSEPDRDVVFLLDSSLASGSTYLTSALTLVNDVITHLKINSNTNKTVVGIAQFSSNVKVLTYLNDSLTESELLALLTTTNTPLLSGARHTGLAVANALIDFFTTTNGGRGWASGVPQVLCVITAGDSDDNTSSIETAAATAGANVISVGMTTDVTQAHLETISTRRDADNSFHISNFTSSTPLAFALKRQICQSTIVPQSGASEISGTVEPSIPTYVALSVPSTGIDTGVQTTSGTMNMYYSARNTRPSSQYYDYSLSVPTPNARVPLVYTPTAEELAYYDGITVNVYITLESASSLPAVFTITLDETSTISINVNITSNATEVATSGGLSDGEIAGIVFSCLIVVCAALVAMVYYRFGKPGAGRRKWLNKEKLDRPMDSRAQQKRLEYNVRDRLNSAIRRRDLTDLNDAVEDFMALKLDDYTGDFVKAQRMLAVYHCKQGLTFAINVRNIKILEKAIFKGKRMEYDVELKIELVNAEILLQDLKKTDNLLRRLKRAMEAEDLDTAEALTAELRVLRGCDQSMVDRLLLAFHLREDIEEAMIRRDLNGINESMKRIEEKGLEHELATELKQARKIAKDLTIMEKARTEVMGLKQSRVSEIKSYATPPPGVHEVMMSVYLLLGYHPTQLQGWTAIQALMGKTGREGLRRMIGDLELTAVDVMHARMAKSLLDNFDLPSIREISEALAVFYIFARSMIKEAEKLLPETEQDSSSFSDVFDESGSYGVTPFILR